MIVLEKAPAPPSVRADRRRRAGDEAERQMAHYLDRAFGRDPTVHVLHDLRVVHEGDVAQMDHVLLHRHGVVIVESKSVSGEVHVNDRGEFERTHGRRRTGMPSPIEQARRQGELLRRLLAAHHTHLLGRMKLVRLQKGFGHLPVNVLVAIADRGIIRRGSAEVPELHKADLVPKAVDALLARHRRGAKLLTKIDEGWGLWAMTEDELVTVSGFLRERHEPAGVTPAPVVETIPARTAPASPTTPAPADGPVWLCTHCHGVDLEIAYGRSYYFKCRGCDGNTPIHPECGACGERARLRKRRRRFDVVCRACEHEAPFFVNPA